MKTRNFRWTFTLVVAALLLFPHRSHALFTPYLSAVSNGIAAFATTLTNPTDRAEARVVARVLVDLSKPSDSVASDYNLFVLAATHLGPFALQPPFFEVGSNTFIYFTNVATLAIEDTAIRIAALSDFVRTKKAASNQLARAQATLDSIPSIADPRIRILVGKLVFTRIVAANKLAAVGEAHPGLALDSVTGTTLSYNVTRGSMGTVFFNNPTDYTQTESLTNVENGTYIYDRTGLNSGQLILNGPDSTNTVKLRYLSTSNGTFTTRNTHDGRTNFRRGTFTVD